MTSSKLTDLPAIAAIALTDPFYVVDISLGVNGSSQISYSNLFGEIIRDVSVHLTDVITNTLSTVFTVQHSSSGSVAAGFGGRVDLRLESATNANRLAGALDYYWTTATDATRTSEISIKVVDAGSEFEAIRLSKDGIYSTKEFLGTGSLAGFFGTVGSSDYRTFALAQGTAFVVASNNVPQLNVQSHVRPNGTGTGFNYLYATYRHGAGAGDGDLGTLVGLGSYLESDATISHDVVALMGFSEMALGSVGSGFAMWAKAGTSSITAAATGLEINVTNNVDQSATPIGGGTNVTTGLILSPFKSYSALFTLSEFCSTAVWISAGPGYSPGPGGGALNGTQWLVGITFTENSIASTGYGIDFHRLGASAPPAMRITNNQWIVARNSTDSADVQVISLSSANAISLYGGRATFDASTSNFFNMFFDGGGVNHAPANWQYGTGQGAQLFHRALGSMASPSALTNGTRLGTFRFSGNYDNTVTPFGWDVSMLGAIIQVEASGDWGAVNAPADIHLRTRALTVETPVVGFILTSDRRTVVGNAVVHADAVETFNVKGTTKLTSFLYLGSSAADPAVEDGGIYYNTASNKLRACEGGAWANLI